MLFEQLLDASIAEEVLVDEIEGLGRGVTPAASDDSRMGHKVRSI
jgi:hypothetical protein